VPDRKRIGLRDVRALLPGETRWDGAVRGFGIRRQKGDAVAYVVFYRTREGRQRWHTIGRHGAPWTPDTARDKARELLGNVAQGADPAGDKRQSLAAVSVGQLADAYLRDCDAGRVLGRNGEPKKASTLALDRGRIASHIKPWLGTRPAASVTRDDVTQLMHAIAEGRTGARRKTRPGRLSIVRGGRTAATRVVGLLGGIFTYAIERRLRDDNPVRGVRKFADRKRERRLSDAEYALLGAGLLRAEAAGVWPAAIACTRFLAVIGWRRGESLALRWEDADVARRTAILADTKTGRSLRPLSHEAADVLRSMPRIGRGNDDLVFPASRGDGVMAGYSQFWKRIATFSGLPSDVTPHVLRHSFASVAADLGYSEPTIAALVGHKGQSVTSRYVHSADAVLLAAADAVARRIAGLMGKKADAEVVPLHVRSDAVA
jgi:integrase